MVPAGPDHAQIASVSGLADYLDGVFAHHFNGDAAPDQRGRQIQKMFQAYEADLLTPLMDWLRNRDDIIIVGPDDPELRAPTVSIIPKRKSIQEVFSKLTDQKLMVGQGHFYGVRPLMGMNIPIDKGVLRLSFVHYTLRDEVAQLIKGLKAALD